METSKFTSLLWLIKYYFNTKIIIGDNMKNVTKNIILIVILILLIGLFLIINIGKHLKNEKEVLNTTLTTTLRKIENNNEQKIVSIMIEGRNESVYVKTYSSHLGFKIDYDIDNFTANHLSNGAVLLANIYDSNIFVKVEKLNEDEYYQQYENLEKEEVIDNYIYTYKFFRGNNIYLKITNCILNNPEYEGLNSRMEYMRNSISFD